MPNDIFKCGNPKCNNSIASDGLNRVKLKALRQWAKYCTFCGQRTHWLEQSSLLNKQTSTKPNRRDGGYNDATGTKDNN